MLQSDYCQFCLSYDDIDNCSSHAVLAIGIRVADHDGAPGRRLMAEASRRADVREGGANDRNGSGTTGHNTQQLVSSTQLKTWLPRKPP